MNPIPFIIASYAVMIVVALALAVSAGLRMRRAERRFAAVQQHRVRQPR